MARGGATILNFRGLGECNAGAVDAVFDGESPTQTGTTVVDGKLAAVFEPQRLGARLVGAWDATFRYATPPERDQGVLCHLRDGGLNDASAVPR